MSSRAVVTSSRCDSVSGPAFPGSWWVPLKQRRARLVLSMLEPQAPDSLAGLLIDQYWREQETKNAPAGDETKAEALKESHSYGL